MPHLRELEPPSFRIVPAGADDLAMVTALADVIWREHYASILEEAQIDYMLRRMYANATLASELARGIAFDLAYVDATPIGFASYGPAPSGEGWQLHKLYLLAAHRGGGHGAAMIERASARARDAGATRLELRVNRRNQLAIRAYERAGFVVRESVTVDIGEGFVMDDYVMERTLG